tara:strand:+ start:44 stop:865 length:822 start_codon:yes stop_codon:yes gene_type:complete
VKPIGLVQPEPPAGLSAIFTSLSQKLPEHEAKHALRHRFPRGQTFEMEIRSVEACRADYYARCHVGSPDAKALTRWDVFHLVQRATAVYCPGVWACTWPPSKSVYGGESWGAACNVPRSPYNEMNLEPARAGEFRIAATGRSLTGLGSAACGFIKGAGLAHLFVQDIEGFSDGGAAAHKRLDRLDGGPSPECKRAQVEAWVYAWLLRYWRAGVPFVAPQGAEERDIIVRVLTQQVRRSYPSPNLHALDALHHDHRHSWCPTRRADWLPALQRE